MTVKIYHSKVIQSILISIDFLYHSINCSKQISYQERDP